MLYIFFSCQFPRLSFLDTSGYGSAGWAQERTPGGGGPIGVYSSEAYDGSVMMEQGKGKCELPMDRGEVIWTPSMLNTRIMCITNNRLLHAFRPIICSVALCKMSEIMTAESKDLQGMGWHQSTHTFLSPIMLSTLVHCLSSFCLY